MQKSKRNFVVSVKHNKANTYGKVIFGDGENRYNIVDRNEHDSVDFHAPRLDKLVTEVVPATVTSASQAEIVDSSKFSAFYRLGTGNQYIQDTEGNETMIKNAYHYLTGGMLPAWPRSYGASSIRIWVGNNVNDLDADVMTSVGQVGDGGSPLFVWNETQGQWELTGVLYGGNSTNIVYTFIPQDFLSQVYSEDYDNPVVFDSSVSSPLYWTFDSDTGTGALTQGNTTYDMHGQKESDLNAGKNLIFQGSNGLVDLKNPVLQGAGSLTFRDDYTVTTTNGSTWTGAGTIVNKDVKKREVASHFPCTS